MSASTTVITASALTPMQARVKKNVDACLATITPPRNDGFNKIVIPDDMFMLNPNKPDDLPNQWLDHPIIREYWPYISETWTKDEIDRFETRADSTREAFRKDVQLFISKLSGRVQEVLHQKIIAEAIGLELKVELLAPGASTATTIDPVDWPHFCTIMESKTMKEKFKKNAADYFDVSYVCVRQFTEKQNQRWLKEVVREFLEARSLSSGNVCDDKGGKKSGKKRVHCLLSCASLQITKIVSALCQVEERAVGCSLRGRDRTEKAPAEEDSTSTNIPCILPSNKNSNRSYYIRMAKGKIHKSESDFVTQTNNLIATAKMSGRSLEDTVKAVSNAWSSKCSLILCCNIYLQFVVNIYFCF